VWLPYTFLILMFHFTLKKNHPISKEMICDKAVQYVDDTSQFLNVASTGCSATDMDLHNLSNLLHKHASQNSKLWSDSVCMSGGDLNSSKCFLYAFFPKVNYKRNKRTYLSLPLPSPIRLHNTEDKSSHPILHIPPDIAKQMLGIFIIPDGSGSTQIAQSLHKAQEFRGKFQNTFLSQCAKWIAVETVIEPAIMCPLVNTYGTEQDIQPIVSILFTL
jgi:hypothetical protein